MTHLSHMLCPVACESTFVSFAFSHYQEARRCWIHDEEEKIHQIFIVITAIDVLLFRALMIENINAPEKLPQILDIKFMDPRSFGGSRPHEISNTFGIAHTCLVTVSCDTSHITPINIIILVKMTMHMYFS
jgi:hypothetical protein